MILTVAVCIGAVLLFAIARSLGDIEEAIKESYGCGQDEFAKFTEGGPGKGSSPAHIRADYVVRVMRNGEGSDVWDLSGNCTHVKELPDEVVKEIVKVLAREDSDEEEGQDNG